MCTVSRHIGLNPNIIESAIAKSGTAQIDYERKLEEIEIAQMETEKTLKQVRAADDQLAEMIDEYSEKFSELDKQRKDIIQKAKNQANMIVESANKVIEKTIRDIKEAKADAVKTKKARENVTKLKEELKEEIQSIEKEESIKPIVPVKRSASKPKKVEEKPEDNIIRVGDSVFMADMQVTG